LHNILYLLHKTSTCFGHLSWPLPGSYSLVDVYSVYGLDIWLKHVGVLYNKYKNTVQLIGSEICVHSTVARKMYNIKYIRKYNWRFSFIQQKNYEYISL